jgi:hypothetical protein
MGPINLHIMGVIYIDAYGIPYYEKLCLDPDFLIWPPGVLDFILLRYEP